jgi:hypothetical protein
MKLNTLALAALAALSFVAAPSFAKVQTAGDIGQAEYVLVATNGAGSYFQDLGVSTDGLASLLSTTGTFSQSVTGTEYTKFLNFGGANTQWSVIAVQPLADGFSPGEINAWTTVNVNQKLGTVQNSQSNDSLVSFNGYFNARNAVGATNVQLAYLTPSNDVTDAPSLYEVLKNSQGNAYAASFNGSTVSITAAVPEPSSYAMLAAGLAVVGFVARRRKA